MKIAQFIASSGWGGAEKIVTELSNKLAEEHEVAVVTYPNKGITSKLHPAIRVIIIPKTSRHNIIGLWRVYHAFTSDSFDVIHCHSAKATELTYRLRAFLKIPFISTKHNDRKGRIFEKIPYVAAVSKSVSHTINHPNWIIYNGIEANLPLVEDSQGSPFKIIAIGRLDPIKGFDQLVDQAYRVDRDFRLSIIGEGPQRAALKAKIQHLKLGDTVQLTGHRDNISELMTQSDLVVISSWREGFSLVAVEALFHAKMLISTPVGIAKEILPEELLSEMHNLGDAITKVIDDFPRYRRIFKSIQNKSRDDFHISHMADKYRLMYEHARLMHYT